MFAVLLLDCAIPSILHHSDVMVCGVQLMNCLFITTCVGGIRTTLMMLMYTDGLNKGDTMCRNLITGIILFKETN